MKAKSLVVLVALMLVGGSVQAAYWSFYTNGGGDQLWSNPANWDDPAGVPSLVSPDYAAGLAAVNPELLIDGIGGYAEVKNFITGVWGGANEAKLMNSVYFYVSESMSIGYATAAGTPAPFVNDGGTLEVGGSIFVGGDDYTAGNGVFYQNGGSVHLGWRLGIGLIGTGLLQINAGTVTADGPLAIGANGVVDLAGGDLWFAGDTPENLEALLLGYIGNNQVIANGGAGAVQYEFDEDAWKMHVWGVPEPATLAMLTLGGVAIARKRK